MFNVKVVRAKIVQSIDFCYIFLLQSHNGLIVSEMLNKKKKTEATDFLLGIKRAQKPSDFEKSAHIIVGSKRFP